MKKLIMSVCLLLLCGICGAGAFFFLQKGETQHKQDKKPVPELIGLEDIIIQEGESLPESLKDVQATETVKEVQVDVSKVQPDRAGTYPIVYTYIDTEGKKHKKEIQCVVEPKKKNVPESGTNVKKEENVPDSGTNIKKEELEGQKPPKTGDSMKLLIYTILGAISAAVIGASIRYQKDLKNKM